MKLNPLTLNFPDEREQKFRIRNFENSLNQFRLAFVIVGLLYALFGILDSLVVEEFASFFFVIRFGIVIPLLTVVFLLSYTKFFFRVWQELTFICLIVGGAGVAIMTVMLPAVNTYYGGLMLIYLAGYFFIRLRFYLATLAGWSILLFFNLTAVFYSSMPSDVLLSNNFFFVSANLIGMFAAYNIELYERKDFFLNQQLDARNAEVVRVNQNLESIVLERTEELNKAKEKAEESDRLKSAFLANMSHEIRTPLNSIIGFSELLNDADFDEVQKKEFRNTIVESGNSLMVIINDIMDLSMLDSRQMKIRVEPFLLHKIFTDLEVVYKKSAADHGIGFRLNLPAGTENIQIVNDIYRIKQICNNLLNNAIKFTAEGFVEFGFQLKPGEVEFFVKDTGIGIPAHLHSAIFERFRQADTSKARKYGGNGLGLALSQKLAEVLGGSIRLESEEAVGTTFYLTLPI